MHTRKCSYEYLICCSQSDTESQFQTLTEFVRLQIKSVNIFPGHPYVAVKYFFIHFPRNETLLSSLRRTGTIAVFLNKNSNFLFECPIRIFSLNMELLSGPLTNPTCSMATNQRKWNKPEKPFL